MRGDLDSGPRLGNQIISLSVSQPTHHVRKQRGPESTGLFLQVKAAGSDDKDRREVGGEMNLNIASGVVLQSGTSGPYSGNLHHPMFLPFHRPHHRYRSPASLLSPPSGYDYGSPTWSLRSSSSPSLSYNRLKSSGTLLGKCISAKAPVPLDPNQIPDDAFVPAQKLQQKEFDILKILKGANSVIPHVVLASTVLALVFPPSFTWFTTRYYAPALGFLMFAVGVNSSPQDFLEAIRRPEAICAGYVGQFFIKPLLGYLFGTIAVTVFHLPTSIGVGIMLVSCVSGAQLSNYATFLTDPPMAPLSIVMTSLSTATAVFVTPMLSLLLIGQKLPVDVKGMMSSITQIVVAPIAAGLLLNRFLPQICASIQPLLPPLSVFVTALCVGSPLAINMESIISPFGLTVLLLVFGFHALAFITGYFLTGLAFPKASDVKSLQRTLSFEIGMQSSLLALALANKFFQDPLVSVPPAISVVMMSLMGFSLVMLWSKEKNMA